MASDLISRNSVDGISWRGRWNRLAMGSWMERNRCKWPGDLNFFITLSRCRVGWWEFSARLFKPLCDRCATLGIISRFAAPYDRSLSVIMTRGTDPCRLSSLRMRRLASVALRRLCTSTSICEARKVRCYRRRSNLRGSHPCSYRTTPDYAVRQ